MVLRVCSVEHHLVSWELFLCAHLVRLILNESICGWDEVLCLQALLVFLMHQQSESCTTVLQDH